MDTARAHLMEALKPLLPSSWKLLPYFTNLDVQTGVVAMLVLESVERAPANPQGSHVVSFTLQLREPKTDPSRREDSLDSSFDDLVYALDRVPGLWWSKAERVIHGNEGNESLAFDIALSVLTEKNIESEAN
jgi:hypothetical protein